MTTHEVLVKARALVERGWVPYGTDGTDPHRGQYCAIGAVAGVLGGWYYANTDASHEIFGAAQFALRDALGFSSVLDVAQWNDRSTKPEVLAAYDRAIAATAPEPDTSFLNDVELEVPA